MMDLASGVDALTNTECENVLMYDILRLLQEKGGVLTREEIDDNISDIDSRITPEYIHRERTAQKTGTIWRPYDYRRNFALKHLWLAGIISYHGGRLVTLTDKGEQIRLADFNAVRDVRSISAPKLKALERQRLMKKLEHQSLAEREANEGIEEAVMDAQTDFRRRLLAKIARMSPYKFEQLCRRIMKEMGVELDAEKNGVPYMADGGIDGFGYYVGDDFRTVRIAVQAKRKRDGVGSPEIDKFIGAVAKNDAEYGVFMTNSYFTQAAKTESRKGKYTITLVDGNKLVDLICKYQIGVRPVTSYEIIDESCFAQDGNLEK